VYVTSGTVIVSRGRGQAELEPTASAYFPKGEFHRIRAGTQGATVLICHVLEPGQETVETTVHPGPDSDPEWDDPNVIVGEDLGFRWALLEEFEPWVPVEPTKGQRIRVRYLFSPDHGAPDAVAGIASVAPHTHYTLHQHEPAEIYHVLEGSGTIHAAGESLAVEAGQSVYVPPSGIHGIDTEHSAMRLLWLYNLTECGRDWTWRAVEPIWDQPKPPCCFTPNGKR
jgi:mannose-6-phosphate isomerase-like protein (cupin superfamily)